MADDLTSTLTLSTDQTDYAPGSTATFTVDGVTAGDALQFVVTDIFGNPVSGTNLPWTVIADADGTLQTTWAVGADAAYQSFEVTVVDQTTGQTATADFTDTPPPPPPEPTGFAYTATHIDLAGSSGITTPQTDGVIWSNAKSTLNATLTSSGTGQFGTFVEVQHDGAEQGFNALNNDVLDTKNSNVFNHPLSLSNLQAIHSDGTTAGSLDDNGAGSTYYAFRLDLHQNSNVYLSLDDLQIWQSNNQNLGNSPTDFTAGASTPGSQPSFQFNAGATLAYDLNSAGNETGSHPNSVLLNSAFTAGSGGGADLVVLVPTDDFNQSLSDVYLYSAFGYQGGGWQANSTFEEWGALLKSGSTQPPTPHATLSFTKDTVCPDEGDSVAGKTLLAGNAVEWTYTVQDVGDDNSFVKNITLTDDHLGTLYTTDNLGVGHLAAGVTLSGDSNHDGILEKGETWVFTASGTTVDGVYSNTGTVTGDGGNTVDQTTDPGLSAFDVSGYTGVTVTDTSVTLKKEVSVDGGQTWSDANLPTGPTLLNGFDAPEYRFTITNNSDVSLPVHLVDATLGIDMMVNVDGNGGSKLIDTIGGNPITATWNEGQNTNTATASSTFTDDCGNTASPSATDSANYFGAAPSITIEKDIICPTDGDVLPADTTVKLLNVNGNVKYQIIVTNTGNVDLDSANVSDSLLALGPPTESISNDGILEAGETWTYTVTAAWAAGGTTYLTGAHTNTAEATGSFTDSAGNTADGSNTVGLDVTDSASYFGLDPHITLDKKTNGVDQHASVIQGQVVKWTYDVTNDGNVALTGLHVTDSPTQTITAVTMSDGHNTGDTNDNGIFDPGETWHFTATGIAGSVQYSNTATATTDIVSDDCGDSTMPTATDTSSYNPIAPTLAGLTKGYWATHLTLWDVTTGDEKGAGSELNVTPQYDWDHDSHTGSSDLSKLVTSGSSSSLGLVSGNNNGNGDSGLLLGDINHDGQANDTCDLFFDLASAQAIANTSVSGDARLILASQAIAAQLNEYNDYVYDQAHGGAPASPLDASPTGLIEEAVQWLKGLGPLSNGDSKVNSAANNDLTSPAVQAIINDSQGQDYTLNGGAITLKSTAMSSSDASWTKFANVFTSYTPGTDASGNPISSNFNTVQADGEGLKNALQAYNTGNFVISTDGSLIGWQDSPSGPVYDVHANTKDAFWGILEDQNLLGHTIVGVTGVHV